MNTSDSRGSHRSNSARPRDGRGPRNGPFLKSRKSRSPAPQGHTVSDDEMPPVRHETPNGSRKKRHTPLPAEAGSSRVQNNMDLVMERAPKIHSKYKHPSRASQEAQNAPSHPPRHGHRSKKEKAKDTTRQLPSIAQALSAASEDDEPVSDTDLRHLGYSGPLAAAQFNKMKKEIDNLKKQLAASTKTADKHTKTISDLKRELATAHKANKEKGAEVEKHKSKVKQTEELISGIESNLQCQICIDTLTKPFALSPCGHVLCQGCLQEWFRAAPANTNMDIDDDDEPQPLEERKKSCPCCRAAVRSRPLPLFLVKSMVSLLNRAQQPADAPRPSPAPETEDPWAGIFPVISADGEYNDDDDDDEVDVDDEDFAGHFTGPWGMYDVDDDDDDDYADTSDDEYMGAWVRPVWEPPAFSSEFWEDEYDEELSKLLRRGATIEMIENYNMDYDHDEGIIAQHDNLCLHLGWNIELRGDDNGDGYIEWLVEDMEERPERWEFVDDEHAYLLVKEDRIEHYDLTDSEAWASAEE
ncbi:hypothetical protein EVG20_g548 [Dentipellis fragilis]|uniref:RING-type domain-containing protein n=1 Tax=Dentipellis fragilis TaxID=205917 RepID=A0A4Y9ZF73_9AGAM|nr:hypothetical protein EVG20_g548 [Dentipellis fragilis]